MTKLEAFRYCDNMGYRFMANVIYNRGINVAKRIKGLAKFIQKGISVQVVSRNIDNILVNGEIYGWEYLETT